MIDLDNPRGTNRKCPICKMGYIISETRAVLSGRLLSFECSLCGSHFLPVTIKTEEEKTKDV